MALQEIVARCEALYEDLDLSAVRAWKERSGSGKAIGYLPTYVPREILHACACLPVGILGGGDQVEIVRGDACFQSYLCHLPRSVLELALAGKLDALDGMLFPSTCDVIRNLSGIWKLRFPGRFARYLDVPQNFALAVGGAFYRALLVQLIDDLARLSGQRPDEDALHESIGAYNTNRALVTELYALRSREPWRVPTSEAYLLLRAGMVLPVEEHTDLVRAYLAEVRGADRREQDHARVVLSGSFCEQPPLPLIRTLERAGCCLVDDDFMPLLRWLGGDVSSEGDPLDALVGAWLDCAGEIPSRYAPDGSKKGTGLLESVRRSGAQGVIFAAPSFCDPALLERPMLQRALDEAGIAHTSFQYAENTGQLQPIREQAGTFADSIRLWGEE
jgi:benzoyl-CoA reductase subunit C